MTDSEKNTSQILLEQNLSKLRNIIYLCMALNDSNVELPEFISESQKKVYTEACDELSLIRKKLLDEFGVVTTWTGILEN
jgi:hypothetical protein